MEILIPLVIHGLESCFALRFKNVFLFLQFVKFVLKRRKLIIHATRFFLSKSAFQSILDRSASKLSLENLEKFRTIDFFIAGER